MAILCPFPQGTACCLTLIPAEMDRTRIDLMWVTVGNIVSPRMQEEKHQNRIFSEIAVEGLILLCKIILSIVLSVLGGSFLFKGPSLQEKYDFSFDLL